MEKRYFVVTDVEAGWDCVRGVYYADDKKQVEETLLQEYGDDWEDSRIIHEVYNITEL